MGRVSSGWHCLPAFAPLELNRHSWAPQADPGDIYVYAPVPSDMYSAQVPVAGMLYSNCTMCRAFVHCPPSLVCVLLHHPKLIPLTVTLQSCMLLLSRPYAPTKKCQPQPPCTTSPQALLHHPCMLCTHVCCLTNSWWLPLCSVAKSHPACASFLLSPHTCPQCALHLYCLLHAVCVIDHMS